MFYTILESYCVALQRALLEDTKLSEPGMAVHQESQESGLNLENRCFQPRKESRIMRIAQLRKLWTGEEGQDIAEYAVMLAVILVLVVGTIRLVGSNANNAFSSVASSIQ